MFSITVEAQLKDDEEKKVEKKPVRVAPKPKPKPVNNLPKPATVNEVNKTIVQSLQAEAATQLLLSKEYFGDIETDYVNALADFMEMKGNEDKSKKAAIVNLNDKSKLLYNCQLNTVNEIDSIADIDEAKGYKTMNWQKIEQLKLQMQSNNGLLKKYRNEMTSFAGEIKTAKADFLEKERLAAIAKPGNIKPVATATAFSLFDDFSNNKNGWPLGTDNNKSKSIANGKLKLTGINDSYRYFIDKSVTDLDQTKDYTLSVTAKWMEGKNTEGFGLVFASDADNNSRYRFSITADGWFCINNYEAGGDIKYLKDWSKSEVINQNSSPNIISIKKTTGKTEFFINEYLVATIYSFTSYGSTFGLWSSGAQTIDFDNFSLTGSTAGSVNPKPSNSFVNSASLSAGSSFNFSDDFTSNQNGWELESNGDKKMSITNGKLRIEGLAKFSFSAKKEFDINSSKDFTITVTAKWIDGISDDGFGIDFCSDFKNKRYSTFLVSANGKYLISNYSNSKWIAVQSWTDSYLINKLNVPNIISVRKVGETISFYVNDQKLASFPFDGGYGTDVGLRLSGMQTADFDNFSIVGTSGKQRSYKTITGSQYSFYEDFSDNQNNWLLKEDKNYSFKIENSKLRIKVEQDKTNYYNTIEHPINMNADFTVSAVVRWVEGIDNNGFGINYCGNPSTQSHNVFAVSANGYYKIHYIENNTSWKEIQGWTKSSIVNKNGAPNLLKIQKKGNYISFFINGESIKTIPFDGGYGNWFGFRVSDAQTVEFDQFIVTGTSK